MPTLLVIGATSAIAHAAARRFAADDAEVFLAARDAAKLQAVADDLDARGATVAGTAPFDAADPSGHALLLNAAQQALGRLDFVLVAYGTLPDQKEMARDPQAAAEAFSLNATSVIQLLTHLANRMEAQPDLGTKQPGGRRGTIAVISSVAGDRGRPSNYVYGAAKGAVSLFLGGLRGRLHPAGVGVVTIKPGFVDTPMTADVPKNPLFADPADVGQRIYKAMVKGEDVVYVPGFWRAVMAGIRAVPERAFKRLKL